MAIGTGSNGKDWDDAFPDDWDSNISPVGKKSWLEDDEKEDDSNISPVGKSEWMNDETVSRQRVHN